MSTGCLYNMRNTAYIQGIHMAENGLRIRIDDDLRTEFIQACRDEDQTAAQVLRAYMRQYVEAKRLPISGRPAVVQQTHIQKKQ